DAEIDAKLQKSSYEELSAGRDRVMHSPNPKGNTKDDEYTQQKLDKGHKEPAVRLIKRCAQNGERSVLQYGWLQEVRVFRPLKARLYKNKVEEHVANVQREQR